MIGSRFREIPGNVTPEVGNHTFQHDQLKHDGGALP